MNFKWFVPIFLLLPTILGNWSPDNQHFLFTYSSVGGANLDRKMFSLGDVCLPSKELPVPNGAIVDEPRWVDASRFLA